MRFLPSLNNLRTVLLLQVVLPVFLLLGLLLTAALGVIGEQAEERLQRDLRQVARAIRLPVAQALERNDPGQLTSSMAGIFGFNEVYGAYLFNRDGDRVVSFGSVDPGAGRIENILERSLEGEREFDVYEQISGRNVYSYFLPLFDTTGQPNGILQVTRRRSDIEEALSELRQRAWLGFGVVLLLMVGCLTLTHARAIGRPLEALLASMRRVEAGDRAHRSDVRGPREIQQIARRLNTMLDAIRRAEEDARREYREKERMAEKLRQAETMAMLGQVSAGVAHELGSPLSVIDGRANRLLRQEPDEVRRRELDAIREQVGRMSALVRQLLSLGRSSRARRLPLGLDALFKRLAELDAEEGRHTRFEAGPPARVMGDPFGLEQAIGNLLRNAWQACPAGPVAAGWRVDEAARQAVVFVEDAGPGVEPALRDQLFEPFVTSKIPGQGSGMGLAIVRRVALDHQGEVAQTPSRLGGARFEVRLPLHEEEQA